MKWVNDNLIFATLDAMGAAGALDAVQRPKAQPKAGATPSAKPAASSGNSELVRAKKRRRKVGGGTIVEGGDNTVKMVETKQVGSPLRNHFHLDRCIAPRGARGSIPISVGRRLD